MCLALAIWMISMTNAAWYDKVYAYGSALMIPLAVLLGMMGIFAYLHGRSLDAVVFFGGTGLVWSAHTASVAVAAAPAGEPLSYAGWYWAVWTVFFCYLWVGSFKAGIARQLFLLGLTIALGTLGLYDWMSLTVFRLISGYVGLISAVIALVASAGEIIYFGREAHSPNDDRQAGQPQPTA
jgi:succinate-acetate transporter protein